MERVGKMLRDFFDRGSEKEVEMGRKTERSGTATWQGTLMGVGGASAHSPGQIGLFQPTGFRKLFMKLD